MSEQNPVSPFSDDERMRALIENVSAYIEHFHGGSVELISFDGKVLKVRLGGACYGCPSFAQYLARLGRRYGPPILSLYRASRSCTVVDFICIFYR